MHQSYIEFKDKTFPIPWMNLWNIYCQYHDKNYNENGVKTGNVQNYFIT